MVRYRTVVHLNPKVYKNSEFSVWPVCPHVDTFTHHYVLNCIWSNCKCGSISISFSVLCVFIVIRGKLFLRRSCLHSQDVCTVWACFIGPYAQINVIKVIWLWHWCIRPVSLTKSLLHEAGGYSKWKSLSNAIYKHSVKTGRLSTKTVTFICHCLTLPYLCHS